ncbi:hypothetical protein DL96DRAFT_1589782 [Flagelloscypha sp. PMI_526]|nr:hypothetical protein DL96DRAFT_1589782 [Flagelloscypha sp. PMI_526]
MATSQTSLPGLPEDLEYLIFTLAARSDPDDIPTLTQVCRRVSQWVNELHSTTLIIWSSTPKSFLDRLCNHSPEFLASHVSHVWVNSNWPESTNKLWANQINQFLPKCTGITRLTVLDFAIELDYTVFSSLEHLSIPYNFVEDFADNIQSKPDFKFNYLTHLDWHAELSGTLERVLPQLPALTHVLLENRWTEIRYCREQLIKWLSLPQITTIVIFTYRNDPSRGSESRIRFSHPLEQMCGYTLHPHESYWWDEKVFWIRFEEWNFLEDWKASCRGSMNFWDHLEAYRKWRSTTGPMLWTKEKNANNST